MFRGIYCSFSYSCYNSYYCFDSCRTSKSMGVDKLRKAMSVSACNVLLQVCRAPSREKCGKAGKGVNLTLQYLELY